MQSSISQSQTVDHSCIYRTQMETITVFVVGVIFVVSLITILDKVIRQFKK